MIALLRGRLHAFGEDWAIIDTGGDQGGVGYLVHASSRTLGLLGPIGSVVALVVETHVREDAITLFAFQNDVERDWFRLLFTVQGVGAKVALGLLSALSPEQLGSAIASGDKTALTRAPGVGPKLAARLVTELKDKALSLGARPGSVAASAPIGSFGTPSGSSTDETLAADAISALVNLGYGRADAFDAVGRAAQTLGPEAALNALIQRALKDLGKD